MIAVINPRFLLRIEGAAVLLSSCLLYRHTNGSWLWFGLLFFAVDLSMLGYVLNKRIGAATYNLAHTYTTPILLLWILWFFGVSSSVWLSLIWFAHIGFDRLLGYGLKYETAFKDTHFQRI